MLDLCSDLLDGSLVYLQGGAAAHHPDDPQLFSTVRAGRPCINGLPNHANLVVTDQIQEAFDQPPSAALVISEQTAAATAFNLDHSSFRHPSASGDWRPFVPVALISLFFDHPSEAMNGFPYVRE